LDVLCGYIALLKLYEKDKKAPATKPELSQSEGEEELDGGSENQNNHFDGLTLSPASSFFPLSARKVPSSRPELESGEKFDEFVLFDCVFGVPLFDETLNSAVCERLISNELLSPEK
jgi:hypothetical protein